MKTKVNCSVCGKEELVYDSRLKNYSTCSHVCSSKLKLSKRVNNCTCTNCGVEFHRKESQMKRYGRLGFFCKMKCASKYKRKIYLGENNPNFRGSQYDSNGYRVNHYPKIGRLKEHRYVTIQHIQREIPKGFIVHHKDCNIYNNAPFNLCVMSQSDHIWIHKQFGNATLWAIQHKKVSLRAVCEWSTDKKRAWHLLNLDINYQIQHEIMSYFDYKTLLEYFNNELILPYPKIQFEEVLELSATDRGSGGYGSTGN